MMKKITIEEAKKIELNILSHIDNFCKNNNIEYFINYGTLIGAVRHKGFIPWDDDIDISMTRENYDKFINLYKNDKSKYELLSLETNKHYFNNFAKIIDNTTRIDNTRIYKSYPSGIFIDIFPVDSFADKKIVDICYALESFKLLSFSKRKNIIYKDNKLKDFIRGSFWLLLRPVSPRFFAKMIERYIKKYSTKKGPYVAFLPSKFKYKEVFTKEVFSELVDMKFEHLTLPAPKNYDLILTQYYNDYMELPPEKERYYGHEFNAYKLDE